MRFSRLASSILAFSLLSGSTAFAAVPAFSQPPPATEVAPAPAAKLDRAKVKAALAKRRAQNLALFRAYRNAGVYPHNFFTTGKLNVWLDDEGRLCAAATIIANSGNRDLVMKIAEDNNFIRLADVMDGELMDWILTSGLTQEEIVAIQEPFSGARMQPNVVPNPEPRLVEDNRLRARYAQVDRMIVKGTKQSLDRAVDRLMANPSLAKQLLAAV